jgi:hypothetical protein
VTAEIVQLRAGVTAAQRQRVIEWAKSEVELPTRGDDRSLCQDIAHLMRKIELTAFLLGAPNPSAKEGRQIIREIGCPLDQALLRLYEGAEDVLWKSVEQYPETQEWRARRKPRRRERSKK